MDTQKEKWLIERLTEGKEVKDLFPSRYYMGKVFYEVYFYSKEAKVVVVLKTTGPSATKLEVAEVFSVEHVEKEPLTSKLVGKTVIFEPSKISGGLERNNFCLVGKLYLKSKDEAI